MNLVLIGKFKQARDAENIESLLGKLSDQAVEDEVYSISRSSPEHQRFSEKMLSLLRAHELHILSPADLEQFASEYNLDRKGEHITIRTDEADVSAFIKIFVDAGARVEVYSAHFHPEE
jgi:hypothetical protein